MTDHSVIIDFEAIQDPDDDPDISNTPFATATHTVEHHLVAGVLAERGEVAKLRHLPARNAAAWASITTHDIEHTYGPTADHIACIFGHALRTTHGQADLARYANRALAEYDPDSITASNAYTIAVAALRESGAGDQYAAVVRALYWVSRDAGYSPEHNLIVECAAVAAVALPYLGTRGFFDAHYETLVYAYEQGYETDVDGVDIVPVSQVVSASA